MRLRCRPRPPIVEKRAECCPAILIGSKPASAVSDCSEGCAHALAADRIELSESPRQQRLRHCSEVVERHRALVFDPVFWAHRHTGRNVSDGACHRRHNHVVEHGNGLVSGHHKRWPRLLIRGLEQPQLALSYHGSASVMAIAFARAAASSVEPCGMCRYDAAIASPSRARLIESAKWLTACRTTSDRFEPMPAATRRSMTSVCFLLKRVGIGVVIQSAYELLYTAPTESLSLSSRTIAFATPPNVLSADRPVIRTSWAGDAVAISTLDDVRHPAATTAKSQWQRASWK